MKTHVSAFFLYALLLGSSLLPAQTLEWAKALHGTNGSAATTVTSVACDSEGNIFITGWFSGAVDFDPGAGVQSLSSAGSNDIFIGKYSAEGNLIWVHRLGGSNSNDGGLAIAVDPLGNPIVTGQFARTVDFDPGPASATLNSGGGNSNIFVLKLDQGGNYIWVRGFGGIFDDLGRAVDTDAQGNVYVTGVFRNTMNVAGTTLTSMGGNDVFLIKIDPAGAILWRTSFGDDNDDAGLGLAVHGSSIYLTGRFEKQPLVSPGIQLQSSGGADAFILKATATGQVLWAKSLGGGGMDEGFGLATAPSGEVLLSGWFSGIADMNPDPVLTDTITASGGNDAFLVRLDENGNYQWARGFGGSNSDIGYDVVASSSGRTYLSGWFVGNDANFGTTTSPLLLSSNGQMDAFCAAFDSLGNTLWAHNLGGNGMDRSLSLVMQDFDRVVFIGDFQSSPDFSLPGFPQNLPVIGQSDGFMVSIADRNYPSSLISFSTSIPNHPHPPFTEDDSLWSGNTHATAKPPIKICADGSKATLISFENNTGIDPQFLRFEMVSFADAIVPDADSSGIFLEADREINGNIITWRLTHPNFMNQNDFYRPDVFRIVDVSNGDAVVYSHPVQVYRAPAVALHGLWGNASSFVWMGRRLETKKVLPWELFYAHDYRKGNDQSFDTNRDEAREAIINGLKIARDRQFATGRPNIVGHSMGGIIARMGMQGGVWDQHIRSIITLNTPHSGSQTANYLMQSWRPCALIARELLKVEYGRGAVTGGAVYDLQVGIAENGVGVLNAAQSALPFPPIHAIESSTFWVPIFDYEAGWSPMEGALISIVSGCRKDLPQIFLAELYNLERNDLIVAESSQIGGIEANSRYSGLPYYHTATPSRNATIDGIADLLSEDSQNSIFFDLNGFTPPELDYSVVLKTDSTDPYVFIPLDSLHITAPADSSVFAPGDSISISISGDTDITSILSTAGSFDWGMRVLDTATNQVTFTFPVPDSAIGPLNVLAFGFDVGGEWTGYDSAIVFIEPVVALDSVVPYPKSLYLPTNGSMGFNLYGHYANGKVLPLYPSNKLSATVQDTNLAQYISAFTVAGVETGATVLQGTWDGHPFSVALEMYEGEDLGTNSLFEPREPKAAPQTLHLYPNPTTGILTVEFTQAAPGTNRFEVYSSTGQQLASQTPSSMPAGPQQIELDLSGFPAGMYFVKLTQPSGKVQWGKLFLQR